MGTGAGYVEVEAAVEGAVPEQLGELSVVTGRLPTTPSGPIVTRPRSGARLTRPGTMPAAPPGIMVIHAEDRQAEEYEPVRAAGRS
ncbi:hypothetical protein AMK31_35935 [Streptomyces sp. TSRI0107]|nr:hypothetical protein AMK31_35935 [Streptomyces sp. TSRI0107]